MRFLNFLVFLFVFGCGEGRQKQAAKPPEKEYADLTAKQVFNPDSIYNDETGSFYFPSSHQKDSLICLLFFDPQGKGSKPISLYQQLAFKYGVLLAGSNISRNGLSFPETREISQNLMLEIRNRFVPGVKHISFYLSGFSGGAKVAFDAAENGSEKVEGIIYAGAPAAGGSVQKSVFGFAGRMDMNLADVVQFDATLPETIPHYLQIWDGKHEWPSPGEFDSALKWIFWKETRDFQHADKEIKSMVQNAKRLRDPILKERILLKASFLSKDMSRTDLAKDPLSKLRAESAWETARQLAMTENQTELKLKEEYSQAFFKNDIDWWKSEILLLQTHQKALPKNMQERILGFFSLAAYSLSNRALQQNEDAMAEKILEIYRLSDPSNSEQAYLRAILAARRQQADLAMTAITEALSLGFKDKTRLEKQPEFQLLKGSPTYRKMLDAMH